MKNKLFLVNIIYPIIEKIEPKLVGHITQKMIDDSGSDHLK